MSSPTQSDCLRRKETPFEIVQRQWPPTVIGGATKCLCPGSSAPCPVASGWRVDSLSLSATRAAQRSRHTQDTPGSPTLCSSGLMPSLRPCARAAAVDPFDPAASCVDLDQLCRAWPPLQHRLPVTCTPPSRRSSISAPRMAQHRSLKDCSRPHDARGHFLCVRLKCGWTLATTIVELATPRRLNRGGRPL